MTKNVKFKPKKEKVQEPEPVKNVKSFMPSRFVLVYVLIFGLAVAVLAQSSYLQVTRSEQLIKEANDRSVRSVDMPFTRGDILDRTGRVLSTSVPMYSVTIDPKIYFETKLNRDRKRWRELAKEMEGSQSKMMASVNKFIKQKPNPEDKKPKFDPRAIFNIDSEDYWQLLARMTGLEYDTLMSKVRYNSNSEFLRLETEAIKLEKNKLKLLAESIGLKYNELMEKLYASSEKSSIYLARHKSETIAEFLIGGILPKVDDSPDEDKEKKQYRGLGIDGLVLRKEFRRFYPLAEEVSHLIGFTDIEDKGAEGLERSFDNLLIGKNGKKVIRKDAKGNTIEHIREEKQYDPQSVVLSIDEELQSMVYQAIKEAVNENKATSGTAVLVDVNTGEILAMANAPSYNPNNRTHFNPEFARNRAITDTFEPGSTAKPFTVLTALQHKVTYLGEVIDTRPFTVNGHMITDVAPRESLTLTGILQKSSNRGVTRLALRMPSTALVDTYSKVGFGKDTGLGLGEERGYNGDRKRWSDIERATLSYGYGFSVTPLQLASAYATLGSFGIYRPLSVTKVDPPVIGERVLPEKITRDVVQMMETVAHKGEGGQRAAVDGFRVAIKTGTTRKLEKGKYVKKHLAYTAGIAPASDPRFALVVLIDEPKAGNYYGGAVSAPLFSKIMGYTLKAYNIKPDNLNEENRHAVRELKPKAIN